MPTGTGLAPADAGRVAQALEALRRNGLVDVALTGGVATACYTAAAMRRPRPLNDLDLVVPDAEALSASLAEDFLVAHVHFGARPGRMLLQLVHPATSLRIDLFGSVGRQMERAGPGPPAFACRVLSRADLVARLTRSLLDLALDEPVAGKHARDHLALSGDGLAGIDAAWADHRRDRQPPRFEDAARAVRDLVGRKAALLVSLPPVFEDPCGLCSEGRGFRISPAERIVASLGYR